MSPELPHSLRSRLLRLLLAAISLAALAQTVIAYRTALAQADEIFDHHMEQMALSLRPGLPAGGALEGSGLAGEEENYDFMVQVWSANGVRIFQSTSDAALPQRAVLGFSDVQARGTTYRVFSVQTRSQIIQVAQDMAARREMAGTLALRTVSPIIVMAPLLMLVVWWAVGRSLAPVARVRRQLAERQANDLSPVSESGLPEEVRPLVKELNLLFERVRQAFDAQQHFVADAAHELRSPLAALKLQAQSLQRPLDEPARELAVSRLLGGIDRATRLIEQLLVLARQEAGASSGVPPVPVVLAELARTALADAIPAAQRRHMDIGLVHAQEASIQGHPEALKILLRNLLDNAIKYTPVGGRVDLAIQAEGGELVMTVEDSGPGIRAEDRQRVLDRFYRMGGTEAAGSGLGLAIVKTIAGLHGASVSLDTAPQLGGLRVTLRFPGSSSNRTLPTSP